MNKILGRISIGAALSFLIAGGAYAEDLSSHPQIDFATGSPTGGWYPIGAQISDMTNKEYEGQPVSVVPGGGVGNVARVGKGEVELGISYGSFLRVASLGEGDMYEEAYPELRAVAGLLPTVHHLIATPDSEVKTFSDLIDKEASLATGLQGSGEFFTIQALLSQRDLSIRDMGDQMQPMQTQGRVDAWQNRQVDAVNFFLNVPAGSVSQLLSARDGTWVEIDEESVQRLGDEYGYLEYTIPSGTYPGQEEDVNAVGMPMVVFASTRLDEDLVYKMTKAIAEDDGGLISVHSGFKDWDPSSMPDGLGVDLHEGAKRYYKEQGWIE